MQRRTFLATAAALTLAPFSFAKPQPMVWQINEYEWYLAPTLEEAIQCSMKETGLSREEVYSPSCGTKPLNEAEVAELRNLYDDNGDERSGLEVYRELLSNGATVQPFTSCD